MIISPLPVTHSVQRYGVIEHFWHLPWQLDSVVKPVVVSMYLPADGSHVFLFVRVKGETQVVHVFMELSE